MATNATMERHQDKTWPELEADSKEVKARLEDISMLQNRLAREREVLLAELSYIEKRIEHAYHKEQAD